MTEHELDHIVVVTRIRPGRWQAVVYRNTFDARGVIDGSVRIADVYAWTERGARRLGRQVARRAHRRGARWPKPDV